MASLGAQDKLMGKSAGIDVDGILRGKVIDLRISPSCLYDDDIYMLNDTLFMFTHS